MSVQCACIIARTGLRCRNYTKQGTYCRIHTLIRPCGTCVELKFKVTLVSSDDTMDIDDFSVASPAFQRETIDLIKEDTELYYLPMALDFSEGTQAVVKSVTLEGGKRPFLCVELTGENMTADFLQSLANSITAYDDDGNHGYTYKGKHYSVGLRRF